MLFRPAKIDWKAASATKPPEILADVPGGISRGNRIKRVAMFAKAAESLGCIPEPGESYHFLMTGRYDFCVLVALLLQKNGKVCKHLRIATLSYGRRNIEELCRMLDDGTVAQLSILCGEVFREKSSREYNGLQAELAKRPGGHVLAAARSHCKVVCIEYSDSDKLSLEGSANLTNSHNVENMAIFNDVALHDWHAGWLDNWIRDGKAKEEAKNSEAKPIG